MKLYLLLLFIPLVACKNVQENSKLIWQDEINYSINEITKNWNIQKGYGGNGYPGNGWGNDEWQNYTEDNLSIENGILVITANKTNKAGKRDGSITSARITTESKFSFNTGVRIEARIKAPWGKGVWPAFWALGHDYSTVGWPSSGEIDILEIIGDNPKNNKKNQTIHSTLHWNDVNDTKKYKHAQYGKYKYVEPSVSDSFNIYELFYTDSTIETKFNGQSIFIMNTTSGAPKKHFHKPFFLLLNLAVGGHWPGGPSSKTIFPQKLLVDYIRVYKL